jgi:hypothetical protein
MFCIDKKTLTVTSSYALPSRQLNTRMVGWLYRHFSYFRRCLGVHHGTLVTVPEVSEIRSPSAAASNTISRPYNARNPPSTTSPIPQPL